MCGEDYHRARSGLRENQTVCCHRGQQPLVEILICCNGVGIYKKNHSLLTMLRLEHKIQISLNCSHSIVDNSAVCAVDQIDGQESPSRLAS